MFHSSRNLRQRAAGVAGGLALLGTAGMGLASGANAATWGQAKPTLDAIKFCESSNNYQAQNPTSTASGAYQFLDTTWQSLDASAGYSRAKFAPASVQDAAALELYNEMGTSPWAASSSCWAK